MPKNDNPHAIRLYESIAKHMGEEAAGEMAAEHPLSKAADINKRFLWAESICADLESAFDEDTAKQIRMDCACGPEMGKMAKLRKLFQSCSSMADFAEKASALNQGYTIEYDGGALILIYPQCYCSCVKRVSRPISKTWCYCTLGYTKRMFGHILGREVGVALLESVKTGGDACRIRVS
jgi:hypothetical protein